MNKILWKAKTKPYLINIMLCVNVILGYDSSELFYIFLCYQDFLLYRSSIFVCVNSTAFFRHQTRQDCIWLYVGILSRSGICNLLKTYLDNPWFVPKFQQVFSEFCVHRIESDKILLPTLPQQGATFRSHRGCSYLMRTQT